MKRWTAFGAALFLASCSGANVDGPVTMSMISSANTVPGDLIAATAQGLVSFDAEGRIAPALAERWIVIDDGKSIIFRIRRSTWADGRPVNSIDVAQGLSRALSAGSRNPLKPLFTDIEKITAMTGEVLEIRLKTPQPELLQLLAQPEMAIWRNRPDNGTGPYRIHSKRDDVTRLRLIQDGSGDDILQSDTQHSDIRFRRETASAAVTRFAKREIALVTGGDFNALPLVRPAGIATSQFSVDPAYGLFGLIISAQSRALSPVNARRALAMAIDRERLVGLFGVNLWKPQYSVLPSQLDSANPPAALEWVALDQAARIARAKTYLAQAAPLPVIRIALPRGPGARLLFAALSDDWRRIGVNTVLVTANAPADLRLIDEVAPQQPALWYLERLSCAHGAVCSPKTQTALTVAVSAQTLAARSTAIAVLDAAMASEQPYIPIALPLRWSLVSPELTMWRPNAFALHPLNRLRDDKR